MERERQCPKCKKMIKITVGSEDDELTDEEYLCEECRKINPFVHGKRMMGKGPVVFSQKECSCGEKFTWYAAAKAKRNHGLLCKKCGKVTDTGAFLVAPWLYAEN